jgi:hypothetical protein
MLLTHPILASCQIRFEEKHNRPIAQSFPVLFILKIQSVGYFVTPRGYENNMIPFDLAVKEHVVKWERSDDHIS